MTTGSINPKKEGEGVVLQRRIAELGRQDATVHHALKMWFGQEIPYDIMLMRLVIMLAADKAEIMKIKTDEMNSRPATFMMPGLSPNES